MNANACIALLVYDEDNVKQCMPHVFPLSLNASLVGHWCLTAVNL